MSTIVSDSGSKSHLIALPCSVVSQSEANAVLSTVGSCALVTDHLSRLREPGPSILAFTASDPVQSKMRWLFESNFDLHSGHILVKRI